MRKFHQTFKPVRQAGRLFFRKETPFLYKLIPIGAILYIIFPLDFITDVIPVLGQIDDLGILAGSIGLFNSLAKNKN
ncbi:MAG: DUF1232 domain-containing protein [Patescibacteria group bacterium]|jgi:uncharacterized membrane protein YkvA (DUF1232 family)